MDSRREGQVLGCGCAVGGDGLVRARVEVVGEEGERGFVRVFAKEEGGGACWD